MRWMVERVRRVGVAALVFAAFSLGATDAGAQLRGGSQDLDEAPVTSGDVEDMKVYLGLTDEQSEVAAGLVEAKLAEFEESLERFNAVQQGFQEDLEQNRQDPELLVVLVEKVTEFRHYRDRLREATFKDIRDLVVTEEQGERWMAYERHYRRQRIDEIDTGALSGGSVDLIELVEDREMDDETRENLDSVLERYSKELDDVILKRMELAEDFSQRQIEGMREHGSNFMAMMGEYEKMFDETREVVLKTREITEKYRRLVAATMDEEQRVAFEREFLEEYVPRVYSTSRASDAMDQAEALESVTEEQRAEFASLRERYEREAAPVNKDWADALLKHEEETMTLMEAFGPGGAQNTDVQDAIKTRRELDDRYIKMLRAMLTEEQLGELPDRTTRDWRNESFGS